jgi:hypothetical protein
MSVNFFQGCPFNEESSHSRACPTLVSLIGLIFFCASCNHFLSGVNTIHSSVFNTLDKSSKPFTFLLLTCVNHLQAESKSIGVLALGCNIFAATSLTGLVLSNNLPAPFVSHFVVHHSTAPHTRLLNSSLLHSSNPATYPSNISASVTVHPSFSTCSPANFSKSDTRGFSLLDCIATDINGNNN